MVGPHITEEEVWDVLRTIADPEIPVLSLVDMNIIRVIDIDGDEVHVEITPTFVGCPALDHISELIQAKLLEKGFKVVTVRKNFAAPWTTDMLSEATRTKLKDFGIAPPAPAGMTVSVELPTLCPFCDSRDTKRESSFGSTLCKQLHYCNSCRQSFEQFRSL